MREGEGSLCEAIRQVGTQTAGRSKSIKANLPRFCNSFSIGDRTKSEEPWMLHMLKESL